MNDATAPRPAEQHCVHELLSLLALLYGVTAEAREALAGGALEDLDEVVARRDEILARAAPLLAEVARLRKQQGAAPTPDLEAALGTLREAGIEIQRQDRELVAAISQRRSALSAELRRMSSADAARAAYGPPSPPPAR